MRAKKIFFVILSAILVASMCFITSCDLLNTVVDNANCTHVNIDEGNCCTHPSCKDCGLEYSGYGLHVYKANNVSPTCLESGYTVYTCSVCKDTYTGAETLPLGHLLGEWIFTRQPTADEAGEMYRECERCTYREVEAVAPHEHTIAYADAKAATCNTDGWKAYEYCTECSYTTQTVVKATGHSYGPYVSDGNGTHTRTCSYDASHTETEPCYGGDVGGNSPICEVCNTAYEFAVRGGNSSYGYFVLGDYINGSEMKRLYRDLTATAESFFRSNDDIIPEDGYYIIGEFDMTSYSLTLNEGAAVWKIFYISNPAYYWLNSSVVSRGESLLLTVADDYASASYRKTCNDAIASMTNECNALIDEGMSELEMAVAITAYIVTEMEYAYESDGVTPVDDMWAHNMTGLAMHGYGVCEAYAKSFMYLCLLNGVDCVMGSGVANGDSHAWNYVCIDGEWYGADITWTDKDGDNPVYDDFGLSSTEIFSDHVPHSSVASGVDFIYEAPALSDSNIELVALYVDGEYAGLCKSVDEAFETIIAIDDPDAEYTLDLGYYSFYVGAIKHTVKSDESPTVKKLTIVGSNQYVGEEYLDNNSTLYLPGEFTFNSDVELRDLNLEAADGAVEYIISIGGYTMSLAGHSVYVDLRVVGESESTLTVLADRGAYLYRGADIYTLEVLGDKVVFGADTTVQYGKYEKIYTQNGADVDIKNVL